MNETEVWVLLEEKMIGDTAWCSYCYYLKVDNLPSIWPHELTNECSFY